jgi:hypothetical protein
MSPKTSKKEELKSLPKNGDIEMVSEKNVRNFS